MNRKTQELAVTFKNPNTSLSAEKPREEEDYVNAAACTVDKADAASGQKFPSFTESLPPLAVCWLTLVLIVALRIYFTSVISEKNTKLTAENQQLNLLVGNQTTLLALTSNLTNLNNKLSSDNENLRRNYTNLRVQFDNLTRASAVLESKITNLTAENQNLKTPRNNLTHQIQNMERNSNELNISRAQWSIDAYCPNGSNGRVCNTCQPGWLLFQSSCYEFIDAEPPYQKTWEEAQEDCKGKISDLAVIDNDTEKDYINKTKWLFDKVGISGYWIGLRAEEGTWKWVDGSNLTQSSRIQQPPTNGLCVTSDKTNVWKAVNCSDKYTWLCKKKALSV